MGGEKVRIFEAKVRIFVGGLCDYRVRSSVKNKSLTIKIKIKTNSGCQVAKSIFAVLFSYSTFYKKYSTFISKSIQKFSTFGLE